MQAPVIPQDCITKREAAAEVVKAINLNDYLIAAVGSFIVIMLSMLIDFGEATVVIMAAYFGWRYMRQKNTLEYLKKKYGV